MVAGKSKLSLWVQLIIAVIVLAWYGYDFFHTFFNGMAYTLRLDTQIAFSQSKTAFIFAVLIKIALVTFFIWLFKDFYKKLKAE